MSVSISSFSKKTYILLSVSSGSLSSETNSLSLLMQLTLFKATPKLGQFYENIMFTFYLYLIPRVRNRSDLKLSETNQNKLNEYYTNWMRHYAGIF